jgi:hypothetical protein
LFHIHDEEQWLPYINDPCSRSKHPREKDAEDGGVTPNNNGGGKKGGKEAAK